LYYPTNEIESLRSPVVCCGRCKTPVFVLPSGTKASDEIKKTILLSTAIAPQPKPKESDKARCATCGAMWFFTNKPFLLIEGDHIGKN